MTFGWSIAASKFTISLSTFHFVSSPSSFNALVPKCNNLPKTLNAIFRRALNSQVLHFGGGIERNHTLFSIFLLFLSWRKVSSFTPPVIGPGVRCSEIVVFLSTLLLSFTHTVLYKLPSVLHTVHYKHPPPHQVLKARWHCVEFDKQPPPWHFPHFIWKEYLRFVK